jgi:chaperone modulatory protein CbpM
MRQRLELLEVHLLSDSDWLPADTLCRLTGLELSALVELAELGVVAPRGYAPEQWQLAATALPRLRTVGRLIRDLGLNVSGAALAAELLEREHRLERRLRELERHIQDLS